MPNDHDVSAFRRDFPLYANLDRPLHYLDNAATAQMHQSAFDAMRRHDTQARGNVLRGNHRLAEAATEAYENARAGVARYLNATTVEEIVFTSGTTAAINLVAGAMGYLLRPGDEIVVSLAEHHSNFLPWQRLQEQGVVLRVLPLTSEGRIDMSLLPAIVGGRCRLIALSHASNVTGAITDLVPVIAAARAVGARVLLDGAQYVQHGRPDMQALGADFYVFSGHKCFGPTGVGVLWGRREALAELPPFMVGGGMVGRVALRESTWAEPPRRFEAGTPPIAQAVGLGAVLDWLVGQPWEQLRSHEEHLFERLLAGLRNIPGVRLLGPADRRERLPVVSFNLGELHPHDVCQVLDERHVALRGGHHCAQPLMEFFGVAATVRASLAAYNDVADVDALLAGLEHARQVLA
ncbi:MAG: aminotransferase class V-fold PLP-dependent enzyme [Betaproteobacteria bacterium]|nr:aminotransferase class V-fold PLP-dependent enzyme [Betaproteobacteria bacterium]